MNLMNEDALARLEAALREQREKLSGAPLQASPALSPADNSLNEPIDIPNFLKRDTKRKSPA
jgi:hypothetical protein